MIDRIDLEQKEIHAQKEAALDGLKDNNYAYVVRRLFRDLSDKINEVVDHVNSMEGMLLASSVDELSRGSFRDIFHSPEEYEDVLDLFVNEGERALVTHPEDVFENAQGAFDVVMFKEVSGTTPGVLKCVTEALRIARKRVIMGVVPEFRDDWEMFMARVPYHWENHQHTDSGIEWYIIDKLEGQEEGDATVAPTRKNT